MIVVCDMGDWFGPEEFRRKVATPAQARALEKRMAKIAGQTEHPAGNRTNVEIALQAARASTLPREVGRTPTQSSADTAKVRDRAEGSSGLGDTARQDNGSHDAAARLAPKFKGKSRP